MVKVLRKILYLPLVFSLLLSCVTPPKSQDRAQLDFQTPKGWSSKPKAGFKVFYPPEPGNFVAIKSIPADVRDYKALSTKMWTLFEPGLNLPISSAKQSKSEGGHLKGKIVHDPGDKLRTLFITDYILIDDVIHLSLTKFKMNLVTKRKPQIVSLYQPIYALDKRKLKTFADATPVDLSPRVVKDLDDFIAKAFAEIDLRGAAIGVIQDGKVVFAKGYGYTEAGGAKVTKDTLFKIASATKPLVSLMAAKLVSDGKLKWDDKLVDHLPEWQVKGNDFLSKLRIKDSFCACTGLPYKDTVESFRTKGISALSRLNDMKDWQPTSAFGEVFQYSNQLYSVGGYAAAQSYQPELSLEAAYKKAMRDMVFTPLGMTTSLGLQRWPYSETSAKPHFKFYDSSIRAVPSSYSEYEIAEAPSGAIWSSAADMLKYLELELSGGQSHPGYIDAKELLRRRQKGISTGPNAFYGLGLRTRDDNGVKIHEHSGNLPGYTSRVVFAPDHNWGYVVLENIGSEAIVQTLVKKKLFSLLYEVPIEEDKFLAKAKGYSKRPKRFAGKMLPLPADANELVGLYVNDSLGQLRVFIKNGKLWARAEGFETEFREVKSEGDQRWFAFYGHPMLMARAIELKKAAGVTWTIGRGEGKYTFVSAKR